MHYYWELPLLCIYNYISIEKKQRNLLSNPKYRGIKKKQDWNIPVQMHIFQYQIQFLKVLNSYHKGDISIAQYHDHILSLSAQWWECAAPTPHKQRLRTNLYINASLPKGLLLHISRWHNEFSIFGFLIDPKEIKYGDKT